MKNRDDTSYIWAALDGRDVADFGQLSPAQQSLVLMRAAQIQQTDRCSTLLAADYREHRFLGSAFPTQHQPKEKTMANEREDVMVSARIACHIETLKGYSQLSGRPLDDLLDEALNEYLAANPAKS